MTLPDTVFFPKTVLPLFIFEPRYRQMLGDVLAGGRLFAVATLAKRPAVGQTEFEPPQRIATAGVVRACQKNENGSSNLLLEGVSRIEILGIVRELPYRMIRVRPVPDSTEAGIGTLARLRKSLLRAVDLRAKFGQMLPPDLEIAVREIEDPAALCNLLIFAMCRDTSFQQKALEMTDTAERLRFTIHRFNADVEILRLHQRLQGRVGDDDIGHN